MRTEQVIIYDSCCPMCAWYTGVFVNTGLLPKNGRQTFSETDLLQVIDTDKSRHEIPLVDTQTSTVRYGVDAILQIIGSRYPLMKKICLVKPLNWIIRRVYKLISYNRRVIVAAEGSKAGFDSTPDFNLKYRSALILIGFIINTLILFPLNSTVFHNSVFTSNGWLQVQSAHMAFVFCNVYIATHLTKNTAFEYLGQVNMLALTAMLLTLPLILLNSLTAIPSLANNIALGAILFLTVKEYFRRMKYAGIVENNFKVIPINIFCLIMFLLYLSN